MLEGFHTLTLPMRVGVRLRFPPMAVKLKGVTAAMNPSRPRCSTLFHTLGEWCSGWICRTTTITTTYCHTTFTCPLHMQIHMQITCKFTSHVQMKFTCRYHPPFPQHKNVSVLANFFSSDLVDVHGVLDSEPVEVNEFTSGINLSL